MAETKDINVAHLGFGMTGAAAAIPSLTKIIMWGSHWPLTPMDGETAGAFAFVLLAVLAVIALILKTKLGVDVSSVVQNLGVQNPEATLLQQKDVAVAEVAGHEERHHGITKP